MKLHRYHVELREALVERFGEEELRTLCFDLGIVYEDLPGAGRADKARELLATMQRTARLPELLEACQRHRPTLTLWEEVLVTINQPQRAEGTLVVVNFSHPLTMEQVGWIEGQTALSLRTLHEEMAQFDDERGFAEQAHFLVERVALSPTTWQHAPLVVNPPGYAPAAATLLAELHGRIGHFPTILRLRPTRSSSLTTYEPSELVNLEAVRAAARRHR